MPEPESYKSGTTEPPEALSKRGFTKQDLTTYGIRNDHGDAIFPVPNKQAPVNYKRRKKEKDAKPKYTYELSGVGAPYWHSEDVTEHTKILVCEGELNSMVAHSVLGGGIGCVGVPGASHGIPKHLLDGKSIYLYADNDKAGRDAIARWLPEARALQFKSISVCEAHEKDFCDIAGQQGRDALKEHLNKLLSVEPTLTILDRRITDDFTVAHLRENAKQFITGTVKNPTGYTELDAITFGLPISGISLIAALPSAGKSMMLRDVLFHNANLGKKILLFSPDQSADSIYMLLTSRRCGIPGWRVQRRLFTHAMIDKYGTEDAVIRAWGEAFDDTILNFSKRFRISSESDVGEIKRMVEDAIDDGFEMFGGDYIQIFEPEDATGKEMDGKAIKDIKKNVHGWGVPFLLAAQLAKYKFGRHIKRDGIPYASDIEGSGKYFQAAEQVYMIFNGEVYWKEYVDQNDPPPEPPGFHNDVGKVRIYVRKNKLGEIGGWRYLKWDKEFLTFQNLR